MQLPGAVGPSGAIHDITRCSRSSPSTISCTPAGPACGYYYSALRPLLARYR